MKEKNIARRPKRRDRYNLIMLCLMMDKVFDKTWRLVRHCLFFDQSELKDFTYLNERDRHMAEVCILR